VCGVERILDDILVPVENRRKTAVENSSDSRFNGAAIDITLPSSPSASSGWVKVRDGRFVLEWLRASPGVVTLKGHLYAYNTRAAPISICKCISQWPQTR
jgi:hypothetical protein